MLTYVCTSFSFIGAGTGNTVGGIGSVAGPARPGGSSGAGRANFCHSSILGSNIAAVSGHMLHTNRLWLSADTGGCGIPISDPKVAGVVYRNGACGTCLLISLGP